MYSDDHFGDMWYVSDGSSAICHGPYYYQAEAQEKADELNGGE